MKITFRGWGREVFRHDHTLAPVTESGGRWSAGSEGDPITWASGTKANAKIFDLALSGNFLVEFEFKDRELRNWLQQYVQANPKKALRLLSTMQAEAMIHLADKARSDAISEVSEEDA